MATHTNVTVNRQWFRDTELPLYLERLIASGAKLITVQQIGQTVAGYGQLRAEYLLIYADEHTTEDKHHA